MKTTNKITNEVICEEIEENLFHIYLSELDTDIKRLVFSIKFFFNYENVKIELFNKNFEIDDFNRILNELKHLINEIKRRTKTNSKK